MARTATPPRHLNHFIVDGSNIATEGRAMPSLTQLNEAVLAFIEEHPDVLITVVVDATFGHRIEKKEVKAFDEAVANNELVTPPAGAVGRGDAFVLSIANKAKAGILSNDSFQEFHGQYGWLFDDGRLIGGKPVPHVGWVFVERLPVRGPKSRQSLKDAKTGDKVVEASEGPRRRGVRGSGSTLAEQPLPVPSSPPPGPAVAARAKRVVDEATVVAAVASSTAAGAAGSKGPVNDLLPFLDFVERHPVGTGCTVVVESYASHGAYARSGDVLVYLPMRLMGDPPPRSARAAVKIGEAVAVVIVGYVPERRSVDAALVSAGDTARTTPVAATPEPAPTTRRRTRTKEVAAPTPAVAVDVVAEVEPEAAPKPRRRAKAVAPAVPAEAPVEAPIEQASPPKRARRAAKPAPVEPAPVEPAGTPAKAPSKRAAKQPVKQPAKPAPVAPADVPAEKPAPRKRATKATATPPPEPAAADAAPAPKKRTRATKTLTAKES